MVTGKPPYAGTPVSVMTQHASAAVPDARREKRDISEDLSTVIQLMMAKAPGDRYASPRELTIDLKRLVEGKRPLLARSDASLAALKDAAAWEESAEPQILTRDEMVQLKRRIGWVRGPSLTLKLAAVAAVLAFLTLVFLVVYVIASR